MSFIVDWLEGMHVEVTVTNKCSRRRNHRSSCRACSDVCKQEAILFNDRGIEINSAQCNSCGNCLISCPLSAIDGIAVLRKFDKGSLIFDQSYTPIVKELLIYKDRGLKSIRWETKPLNEEWMMVLKEANEIIKLLDQSPITVVEKDREETVSRRAFFTSIQKEGKQLANSLAPASWKMEAGEWNLASYFPEYQFFSLELDREKCSLCQACFSFCSQQVFSLSDSLLQITMDKCVNCCDCIDICPQSAIQIKPDMKNKIDTFFTFQTKVCQDCGHTFHTFQKALEKCPICIDRNPEWLSPYL